MFSQAYDRLYKIEQWPVQNSVMGGGWGGGGVLEIFLKNFSHWTANHLFLPLITQKFTFFHCHWDWRNLSSQNIRCRKKQISNFKIPNLVFLKSNRYGILNSEDMNSNMSMQNMKSECRFPERNYEVTKKIWVRYLQ